jgi:hypothetical protein
MIIGLIYLLMAIVSFVISVFLESLLDKKYYTSQGRGWPVGRYFFVALFFPDKYFKKKNFWTGYLLFLLSKTLVVISFYFLFFLFPKSLK